MKQRTSGHAAALITIIIWGTTFISTKILLREFAPVEILFIRFIIGFLVLWAICPRRLKITERKQEVVFILAGLCGVCLYYLLENIALTYTLASNVGVIISAAPLFTALLSKIVEKDETLRASFFIGFMIAFIGIALISFQGARLKVNPIGDLLSLLAAFIWACYSILTRKISRLGYPVIQTTRRTFGYGILFMIPALCFVDLRWDLERFLNPVYIGNILFLGLGASALCFVTWNLAVKALGAVKTSVYIYLVPVITVVTSVIVLKEKITVLSVAGIILTLGGLLISERKSSEIRSGKEG